MVAVFPLGLKQQASAGGNGKIEAPKIQSRSFITSRVISPLFQYSHGHKNDSHSDENDSFRWKYLISPLRLLCLLHHSPCLSGGEGAA